jgi:hypothetical protein
MDDYEGAEEYPEEDMNKVGYLYSAYQVYGRTEKVRVPQKKSRNELERDKGHHDHQIRHLLHRVELIVKCGVVRILISNHDPPAIKFGLIQGFFAKLNRVVQWGNVYFDITGYKIVDNPYEIIKHKQPAEPTVHFHGSMKREKVQRIAELYLGSGEYQEDKSKGVNPVPYPYR